MQQVRVNYRTESQPKAPATARRRKAYSHADSEPADGRITDALRVFLILSGAVAAIAAGFTAGVYLIA